jgi:chromate reductase, NAD(P)H dehydrogenase (quinone)
MGVQLMLICGSVRTGSTNAATLRCASELLPDGCSALSYDRLGELPHFNPDLEQGGELPPLVAELRRGIADSGALLFCTPEYAGALPGSLKNLLDWTIGGGEMSGKPVGWINSSDRGAAGAYAELRTVLSYADTSIVEAACARIPVSRSALGPDGSIADPGIRAGVAGVLRALHAAALQATGPQAAGEENLTPGM